MKSITFLTFTLTFMISCTQEISPCDQDILPPPSNLITLEKAKFQLDNYNLAHREELGSEYAFRTWISIDELKSYIYYVEKMSKEKGIEVSGIDFIHTQYKRVEPGTPNPDNAIYEETMMLAPTYKSGTKNVAFDPLYSKDGKPGELESLLDNLDKDSLSKDGSKTPSSIANTLNSCPNVCP